ncbi:hypothetical protein [Deinococcus sp.]|uniref:hypothetical protein n=1 Tax=Deinococcus sp. TaxID=47478 RepID=UPI0025BB1BC0|nr:hypothetical protein [Deinococcus sp.]
MNSSHLTPEIPAEHRALIVVIRIAHRTLTRYYQGDLQALDSLNPKVAAWLETYGYLEILHVEDGVRYIATPKAQRTILSSAA